MTVIYALILGLNLLFCTDEFIMFFRFSLIINDVEFLYRVSFYDLTSDFLVQLQFDAFPSLYHWSSTLRIIIIYEIFMWVLSTR